MYVIAWRSKLTGKEGRGTARFGQEDAAQQCADLNEKYPDIVHWPSPAEPSH